MEFLGSRVSGRERGRHYGVSHLTLGMQCDLGGARARSEEGALGLTPYSQFL